VKSALQMMGSTEWGTNEERAEVKEFSELPGAQQDQYPRVADRTLRQAVKVSVISYMQCDARVNVRRNKQKKTCLRSRRFPFSLASRFSDWDRVSRLLHRARKHIAKRIAKRLRFLNGLE